MNCLLITRLCLKTPSSARERAIFSPGKACPERQRGELEAGDVCSIVDAAGCSQAEKGPLEARSGFQTEPCHLPLAPSRNAFTLIELLVVIAIIAVLMAVLMPSLQRVRKQAQAAACQSNLHQWGSSAMMYATEHDDKVWTIPRGQGEWMEVLRKYYLDVDKIRLCPSATRPCQDTDGTEARGSVDTMWGRPDEQTEWGGRQRGYWGSYGHNRWVEQSFTPGDTRFWERFSVQGAQNVPVFADSAFAHALPRQADVIPPKPLVLFSDIPVDAGGRQIWRFCIDRHNGTINTCFLDGSVRKVRLHNLWNLKWHRAWIPQHYTQADIPWSK